MNRFLVKKISSILSAVVIFSFCLSVIFPTQILAQNEDDFDINAEPNFETRLQLQQEVDEGVEGLQLNGDPTVGNKPDEGAGIPDLTSEWGQNAVTCAGTMAASTGIATAIKGALGLLGTGVEALSNEFLSLEVPVKDAQTRAKDSGSGSLPGGVSLVPSWDAVANCLANLVIESVLISTANWVKGGFEGNPAFVDDPEQFFLDIADTEAGAFLDQISNGILCSPWDVEIRLALLKQYTETEISSCTLTEVIAHAENFINGDFKEGGWKGWFILTQEPNSNPYDSYINAKRELSYRASSPSRSNILEAELSWGNGFLGIDIDDDGVTDTPGNMLESYANSVAFLGLDKLTFADEFDELINALVNTLLEKGIGQILEP